MIVSTIDTEFVHSGDYAQIRQTGQMLAGLIGEGAYVQRGEKKQPVADFSEAMKWLLGEVEKSMTLQRYKGLGEMKAAELRETTMHPASRVLKKVTLEDSAIASQVVNDLMDEARAEARREFLAEAARRTDLDV